MGILGDNLFYSELSTALDVPTQPYQAKPSPSEQFNLLEAIRKTIAKGLFLLLSQSIALIRLGIINVFLLLFDRFHSPLIFFFPGLSLPSSLHFIFVQLDFKMLAFFFFGSIVLLVPEADLIFINH